MSKNERMRTVIGMGRSFGLIVEVKFNKKANKLYLDLSPCERVNLTEVEKQSLRQAVPEGIADDFSTSSFTLEVFERTCPGVYGSIKLRDFDHIVRLSRALHRPMQAILTRLCAEDDELGPDMAKEQENGCPSGFYRL